MIRVRQYCERAKLWEYLLEQLNPLSRQLERKERAASEVTTRLPQAFDDAERDWVATEGKQHGNVCHRRHRAGCRTARDGKVCLCPFQFGYHLPQRGWITGRVVQIKDNVFPLNIAALPQPFSKAIQERIGLGKRGNPKDAVDLCRLLCVRCERRHRTKCKCNEVSPSHVTCRCKCGMGTTNYLILEEEFQWGSA